MQQTAIVFLGPSLDRKIARQILDADYRGPAARGDIQRAVEDGATVIGLIDGVFFQECSVAHREILLALKQGVRVIGASSMGALRAAELDILGMEGVGEIYRMYAEGVLVADDEVALVFDPGTWLPLSEPLVNIRATLLRAERDGIITGDAHRVLLEAARARYFPDRTYDGMQQDARGLVDPDVLGRFSAWLEHGRVDLKREDAIRALERIREILQEREIGG
ncbi:MAG: TfuA-related McrA-glycine thioamidation protein [Methanomicrobiaceae archaeon]|uniref:TfuA-like core domain-containing protein n=1 Tax=hydrocarbon metagenome TaxID=938273 RepID=A0A0W8FHP7_9ZZZZ|nr:TfuA-related McrA-glycine thioamidation protein [Methanomicrobiaceae archaeon]